MLPSSEALSQLLGPLYEAASNPALWEDFLRRLGDKTGATSAALVIYDDAQQSYALSSDWDVDPEATKLYGQHYGSLDIWGQRALSKRASLVCSSETLSASSELVHTEYYHDFLTRFGAGHGMFALFENTGSRLISCSLYRQASRGPFQVSDLEILRCLARHVQRAVKLHAKFCELKNRSESFEAALDSVPTGVVFLGARGNIVLMNRSAAESAGEKDGLLATSAGLQAERQAESDLLVRTIQQAVQSFNGPSVGGTVLVSRRTRPPLQVLVSPVRHSTASLLLTSQLICAVAFVIDPSLRRRPAQDILRALFGLTPAECRVALLLSDGRAPKEIANMLGVTDNTVRSQIKNIFSKTGVKRQAELIRLLLHHSAPTVQPGSTTRCQVSPVYRSDTDAS
jgi:DNA-binding CsgD family transcriptional regulator/PAS domain-containing protein